MSAISRTFHEVIPHHVAQTRPMTGFAQKALAGLRIGYGLTFLWAFFDKLLALGFHTGAITNPDTGARDSIDFMAKDAAWLNGGSPTTGYLSSLDGVFAGLFDPMIGAVWADVLFMVGLGAIGAALMSGIGQRVATVTGVLLLMLMYLTALPLPSNPFLTDYIVMSLALIGLLYADSAKTLGLGRWWSSTSLVQRFPILR